MKSITLVLRCGNVERRKTYQPADIANRVDELWPDESPLGSVRVRLEEAATGTGRWEFTLAADNTWPSDVTCELHVALGDEVPTHILFPTYQSVFERHRAENASTFEFRSAGSSPQVLGDERRLALPMAVLESASGRFVVGADPAFSTAISLNHTQASEDGKSWALMFSWTWLAAAGVHASEHRRLFIQPVNSVISALERWFELATPDVPIGPAWLHDIALADYDYFSKDGRGWYADIDAACEMIAPKDRHRALFCLHGWYDQIGHYCFDPVKRRLDESWIVFPNINHPELLERDQQPLPWPGIPAGYVFRNLKNYRPVSLNWEDVRARLRYAKERGFRTCVYHATGMQTAGDLAPHVADGTGLDVELHLWQGPDLIGSTYLLNPLHPDVRAWMLAYTQALLERVGDLTDALVLDEAYYIAYGTLGPPACAGYADRGQMMLIKQITDLCHSYRADLAYLTADHLGTTLLENRAFPYSLFADGIYHDAWCSPQGWQCSYIPTWRNVTWSCNWAPVSNFAYMRWGVLAYDAPMATTNGCFGDDIGLSDMDHETFQKFADLWRMKMSRQRKHAVTVNDIA